MQYGQGRKLTHKKIIIITNDKTVNQFALAILIVMIFQVCEDYVHQRPN
jgi:hypothetical protein